MLVMWLEPPHLPLYPPSELGQNCIHLEVDMGCILLIAQLLVEIRLSTPDRRLDAIGVRGWF
jgi:hypothetical protein